MRASQFLKPIVIIVCALILFFWLFPDTTIPLTENTTGGYCLSQLESKSPSLRNALADAIQIPLDIKWYDITIKNISYLNPGYILDPDENNEAQRSALMVDLSTSSGRFSNLSFPVYSYGFGNYNSPTIPMGSQGSFTYFANVADTNTPCFTLRKLYFASALWTGQGPQPTSSTSSFITFDSKVSARPNSTARHIKLFILFVFFVFFIPPLLDYIFNPLVQISYRFWKAIRRLFSKKHK